MSYYNSPFRYPGGKQKLANYIKAVICRNNLYDCLYIEPYVGGASVALSLLFGEYVNQIYINDIDRGLFAFYKLALNNIDELCSVIEKTPITVNNWRKQREIQFCDDPEDIELAISTFFLNRTNISGIITGGVIGGLNQNSKWKIDVRFNKKDLISRIRKIYRYRNRIKISSLDCEEFIDAYKDVFPRKSLIYFDPPYYIKGSSSLYTNYYSKEDHERLAEMIRNLDANWILSYDNVPEVRELYKGFKYVEYSLSYTANKKYKGREIMFFSDKLAIPFIEGIASLNKLKLKKYMVEQAVK